MIRSIVLFAIAMGSLLFQAVAYGLEPSRPKVWIYTDMSDPTLPGTNHRGTINDPDDVSAMAGYLLMADRFETLGIVLASTHRKEHATTPDQAAWAKRVFGEAYQSDLVALKRSSASYPDDIPFVQSCIKESAEKFVDSNRYDSLAQYSTVKALFDSVGQLDDDEIIHVLCWGSLTEPAILVAHCLATNNESLLKKLRFIAHWTNSPLHQGTPEHPERVANCQEDAAACRYLKLIAGAGKIEYYECGAIGQHGIVSGSPKGAEYFDQFRASRLGKLFVEGKYVNNCVDHSDSATYWVLLGNYGVSLQDIAADGTNLPKVEKENEKKFADASKQIHDELLRRSTIAAIGVRTAGAVIQPKQPNVIVILADDQGWSDLGCQGIQKDVQTPHIDALASRGVRCTAGYVTAPQCSPSRAGLMTGRHQQRYGIDTIPDMPLPSEALTIAERLQPLGYRTGFVGKWHLEPNVTCVPWMKRELPEMAGKPRAQVRIPWNKIRPYSPAAQGFDEYFWGELRNYRVNFEIDGHEADGADLAKDSDANGPSTKSSTPMKQIENKEFRIDVQTRAAVNFIQRNHAAPFYLQLNYYGPHTPLEATQKYLDRIPTNMPIRRRYALAMIAAIDDGVGRVVEKLTEHGLLDNTLIVFTSDNGAPLKMTKPDSPIDGDAGGWDGSLNEPWVGEKGMLSEGGIRVPMIWSLPSQLPSGKIYDWPVSTLDIAPSVLQLAGGDRQEVMLDDAKKFDGIDLIPAMNGIENLSTRSLYFRFWDQAAIRRGKWKYIYVGNGRRYLFDLESDQHEHKNLVDLHTELVDKLHQDLDEWCAGLKPAGLPTGDKMRERNWYNFYFDDIASQK